MTVFYFKIPVELLIILLIRTYDVVRMYIHIIVPIY